jgi:hypothetical protein
MTRLLIIGAIALSIAAVAQFVRPAPAAAFTPGNALCSAVGLVSGAIGKACTIVQRAGRVFSAGKKLVNGHLGGAIDALTGGSPQRAVAVAGLAAIAASVVGGASYALRATASIVSATTRPDLISMWFSASYWRMAEIAMMLTLPFLCAAVIQAILRADLGLLARTAFGSLPLAGIAIGVAVPATVLLLRASDEMAGLVAAQPGGGASLLRGAGIATGLSLLLGHSAFLAFLLGLLAAAMTLALWLELAVRQAAVTVIVLMLPLFFAAIVWPARRVWAVRAVELLVSLILSKFAIVAVLALGGSALGHAFPVGAAAAITGITLVMLAAFSPWALMRLLPLHELGGAAAAGLRLSGGTPMAGIGSRSEAMAELAEGHSDEEDRSDPAGDEDVRGALGTDDDTFPAARNAGPGAVAPLSGGASGGAMAPVSAAAPSPAEDIARSSRGGDHPLGDEVAAAPSRGRVDDVAPHIRVPDESWPTIHFTHDGVLSDEPLVPDDPPTSAEVPVAEEPPIAAEPFMATGSPMAADPPRVEEPPAADASGPGLDADEDPGQ